MTKICAHREILKSFLNVCLLSTNMLLFIYMCLYYLVNMQYNVTFVHY